VAADALETIKLRLPMLQETLTVKVSELRDPNALLQGSSDLAELDRATNGAIGRKLNALLGSQLPLQMRSLVRNAVGSALLDQVLLLLAALGEVDGINQPPASGSAELEQALQQAAARNNGSITLADVLAVVPGQTATVDLNRFVLSLQRLRQQQLKAGPLVAASPAAGVDAALNQPGPARPVHRTVNLGCVTAAHRCRRWWSNRTAPPTAAWWWCPMACGIAPGALQAGPITWPAMATRWCCLTIPAAMPPRSGRCSRARHLRPGRRNCSCGRSTCRR
jgi:hypothetical protein